MLLLVSLIAIPFATRLAHGALVGAVCVDSATSLSCPVSSPTFSGPVGSQLTVSVNIRGSDSLTGWDMLVKTDPTILNPLTDNLAQTVFPPGTTVFVLANCIGGFGIGCGPHDGPGVVHVALVTGSVAFAPVTGRLFSITYSIAGSSTGTIIGYQTGCTGTSNDSLCVTIVNANLLVPENLQTAFFANSPTFAISARPSSLTIAQGASGVSTITLASIGGFTGTVTLSTAVSPGVKHGPTASLSTTTVILVSGGTFTSILTVNSMGPTPQGSYTVAVTATSGSKTGSLQIPLTIVSKK